jgi:CRP-like cAMP-binding protein
MRRKHELPDSYRSLRLPRTTLDRLTRTADRLHVPSGHVLLDGRSRVQWVWLVVEGALLVESTGGIDTVAAGEQWGAAQVLEHDDRPHVVTAIAPSDLIVLPEREFFALLATDGGFGFFLSHQLAARVARVA